GRVVAVGEGAPACGIAGPSGSSREWRPGDRVMALLAGGGHATRVAVPAAQLMALPEGLSFVSGAALPEAGLTGWTNLVVEGGLKAGETVLVTGATGGMGSFAVQLARELGARVIAAARNQERLSRLRDFGIEDLVLEGEGLADEVRQKTGGRGVDLVFDLTSSQHLGQHLAALRDGGRLVVVGLAGPPKVEVDLGAFLRRRLGLIGSVLRARSRAEKAQLVEGFAGFALPRLADGRLLPVVERVVPFEQAVQAYGLLAAGGAFGKIVLEMS
nr:zinc-binding dehydrogenase [Acidobacteriota bacterium]